MHVETVHGEDRDTFSLHRIKFQFHLEDVKVRRMQFPERLAFAGTVDEA